MEHKREGNIYDRIVKENIESIIPALMNSVLGFSEAKIKKPPAATTNVAPLPRLL